jgi:hypothetical protein
MIDPVLKRNREKESNAELSNRAHFSDFAALEPECAPVLLKRLVQLGRDPIV